MTSQIPLTFAFPPAILGRRKTFFVAFRNADPNFLDPGSRVRTFQDGTAIQGKAVVARHVTNAAARILSLAMQNLLRVAAEQIAVLRGFNPGARDFFETDSQFVGPFTG